MNTTPYAHWTADSGTHELARIYRGAPPADLPTTEVAWWEPRPSVPTRVTRWSWADVWRRVGGFLLLVAALLALSAEPAAAHPVHDVPRYYGPTITCQVAGLFPWAPHWTCR